MDVVTLSYYKVATITDLIVKKVRSALFSCDAHDKWVARYLHESWFSLRHEHKNDEYKMFKQATANDDPAGIRWINSDLIGFT